MSLNFRPARLRAIGLCSVLAAVLALGSVGRASAAVPPLMNYQGYLTDNSSNPVTASYPMTFKLYPDSTTGSVLWSESYATVSVTGGVFNVILGTLAPLPQSVFSGAKLWLLSTVNGVDILPRRPVVTVAYAFRAGIADSTSPTTGAIAGTVQLNCGGSVGGVLVYIPGRSFTCYTDAAGAFNLGAVPPGTYTVHAEAGPSGSSNVTNVVVTAGATTNANATIGPSTQTDPNNCGNCGVVCGNANGTPSCVSGTCQIACNAGFQNCDGQTANGCEKNVTNDPQNCGNCGVFCSFSHATASCVTSTCQIASCNAGFQNCNGSNSDGCEVSIANDPQNCGNCGLVCSTPHATSSCSSGACGIGSCNAGFLNCNGQTADGCEINVTNDRFNCGSCGNVCPVSQVCVNSVCQ